MAVNDYCNHLVIVIHVPVHVLFRGLAPNRGSTIELLPVPGISPQQRYHYRVFVL